MGGIEVRKFRPIKLIAVIFASIAILLVIIAVSASNWVDVKFMATAGETQSWGLWEECYNINPSLHVCIHKDWMSACGALTVLALLACVGAVVLGVSGLCTHNRMFYIIAGVLCVLAAVCHLIAAIVYPVKFSDNIQQEVDNNQLQKWDFDWTYGVGLGGLFFMIAAAIFFFLKQEIQETEDRYAPSYYVNSSHA